MNLKTIAKQYHLLTAEERFRLILAAGARGDDVEQDRLKKAGKRIQFAMPDHAPFAEAFRKLSILNFLALLEEAASYDDACQWAWACSLDDPVNDENPTREDDASARNCDSGATQDGGRAEEERAAPKPPKLSEFESSMDLAMVAGFHLRTKVDGWKLFCKRMSLPPFAHWKLLPGFARFKRRLDLTKKVAFVPEGMVRWLNRIKPKRAPVITIDQVVLAESIADGLLTVFQELVKRGGG